MTEQVTLKGTLKGHTGWVTQIATSPQTPDQILSCSRGMLKAFLTYRFCYIVVKVRNNLFVILQRGLRC